MCNCYNWLLFCCTISCLQINATQSEPQAYEKNASVLYGNVPTIRRPQARAPASKILYNAHQPPAQATQQRMQPESRYIRERVVITAGQTLCLMAQSSAIGTI